MCFFQGPDPATCARHRPYLSYLMVLHVFPLAQQLLFFSVTDSVKTQGRHQPVWPLERSMLPHLQFLCCHDYSATYIMGIILLDISFNQQSVNFLKGREHVFFSFVFLIHLVPSLHGKQMGKQWKEWLTLVFWAPKSLQMVKKLKDAYSLEGNL